jgi:hypothetical protein
MASLIGWVARFAAHRDLRAKASLLKQRWHLPPTSPDISVYAEGPTCCAVCALRSIGQSAIELELRRRPFLGGGARGWTVSGWPLPDGLPNPRPCISDPHRQHWLLVRRA